MCKKAPVSSAAVSKSHRSRSKSPVKNKKAATTSQNKSTPPASSAASSVKKRSSSSSVLKSSAKMSTAGKTRPTTTTTTVSKTTDAPTTTTTGKERSVVEHKQQDTSTSSTTPRVKVIEFGLKAFAMNVLEDATGQISESGKWPLIIDESEKVAVFLHFQNAKELDLAIQRDMDPDNIRRGVLGAIRFGHPVMLQLHDITDIDFARDLINKAQPHLFEDILSKDILKPEKYLALRREGVDDMEVYGEFQFNRINDFIFIPVVSSRFALHTSDGGKEWGKLCMPICIFNPEDRRKAVTVADDSDDDE